jgi:bifunctional non-homologous end joining protein LigD
VEIILTHYPLASSLDLVLLSLLFSAFLMQFPFQPMPLQKRRLPFDHSDWLFELKYDGFRALLHIKSGRSQLISRNGNPFASFSDLANTITGSLPLVHDAVLDGEIVCLDRRGHPQFNNLLFRRGEPRSFAFDLLWNAGKDHRLDSLLDRKYQLKGLLSQVPVTAPIRFADHIEGSGVALFERVCKLDLEGVVAKHKYAPYVTMREQSTWFKIRNPRYSQWGREQLFERDRSREPVPGWHCCTAASAELQS